MRSLARILLAALAVLLLASCRSHPWYLVESTYQGQGEAALGPEIVRTPTYHKALGQISTIAVGAPSRCAPLSPTEEGESAVDDLAADPLRSSECGVELAEFERAIVRTGYRVISWDAVNQMVVHGYLTPLEAARGLGADVLFQVNSIERSTASDDDAWQRVVYVSDGRGAKQQTITVPPERVRAIAAGMRAKESALLPMGQAGIALNLTAVLTRNGEAIWFYEGIHQTSVSDEQPVAQLFLCNRKALSRCYTRNLPGEPRTRGVAAAPAPTPEQREQAYAMLLRGALESVVTEFQSGGR